LSKELADLAGNGLASEVAWDFRIFLADLTQGKPAEASGNLDFHSFVDVYAFEAAAGQSIYFDERSDDCQSGLV
jgi:hypothetical protein